MMSHNLNCWGVREAYLTLSLGSALNCACALGTSLGWKRSLGWHMQGVQISFQYCVWCQDYTQWKPKEILTPSSMLTSLPTLMTSYSLTLEIFWDFLAKRHVAIPLPNCNLLWCWHYCKIISLYHPDLLPYHIPSSLPISHSSQHGYVMFCVSSP